MFPDTCGIRLFLDPAVVVGQPLLADPFDHIAQQLDLGQQSVDVGLRYDELIVVTRHAAARTGVFPPRSRTERRSRVPS